MLIGSADKHTENEINEFSTLLAGVRQIGAGCLSCVDDDDDDDDGGRCRLSLVLNGGRLPIIFVSDSGGHNLVHGYHLQQKDINIQAGTCIGVG